jgi:hypothetical protein
VGTLGKVLKAAGYLGNIIQFICILEQCFPTWVPRNPSVAHNVIRSSARNNKVSEHRFWNTAKRSKYPAKYRGKFCPSIGLYWRNPRALPTASISFSVSSYLRLLLALPCPSLFQSLVSHTTCDNREATR